jgi:phage gp45-like
MSDEQVYDLRSTLLRGVVKAVNDGGPLQTIDVEIHDGDVRSSVEVAMPYGMVSVPPAGAIVLLGAVGADPADLMAIAVLHPGARAGGATGSTCGWADAGGNRMVILPDGTVEIASATSITLTVGGTVLSITGAGVTITGSLTVTGPIHGTADVADVAHAMG